MTAVRDSKDRSMTIKIKTALCIGCATLAFSAGAAFALPAEAATARREANGAIRYYDDNGFDRGYAWCLKRGGRWFGGWSDCSFFSYAQCRAAIIGPPGGDCEPNPWAYAVQEPPARRARR
jgi:hypothetical protein